MMSTLTSVLKSDKLQGSDLLNDLKLVKIAEQGISTQMIWNFIKWTGLPNTFFDGVLPISTKQMKSLTKLDGQYAEQTLNIMRVFKRGKELFGSVEGFTTWIDQYNPFIEAKPSTLLNTTTGCRIVEKELVRAEYGLMA